MKINIKRIVAKNVKKLRASKKLSQNDFAEAISLQMQAISHIENAKTFPLPETITNICEKFEISPAVLFTVANDLTEEEISSAEEFKQSVNLLMSEMDTEKLKLLFNIASVINKN